MGRATLLRSNCAPGSKGMKRLRTLGTHKQCTPDNACGRGFGKQLERTNRGSIELPRRTGNCAESGTLSVRLVDRHSSAEPLICYSRLRARARPEVRPPA